MARTITLNRYEYLIEDGAHTYMGSYTIKEGVKPKGYKNEVLVDSFKYLIQEEEI